MGIAKEALPVLLGLYGSRIVVSQFGPMIPGVSNLGALQGPVLAVGTLVGLSFLTGKVSALAKHRNAILLGSALNALDSLISAFAPASLKGMIGTGEYVGVGEYIGVGATPIDDDLALSDYIAVGSDGVEEELGLEEELGVEEELGNDMLGGVTQGSMLKQVPGRQFLAPVPTRSFTRQIPAATSAYDNPGSMYQGIFRGGF